MPDLEDAVATLAKRKRSAAIAADLVALLAAPPYTAQTSKPLWKIVIAALRGPHAVPASVAPLTALAANYQKVFGPTVMGRWLEGQVRAVAAELAGEFPSAPRTVATVEKPAPKKGSVDALHALVLASPDDDAPRHVLADKLLELGDPRGEFIQLQLQNSPDEKRVAALLAAHEKAWLGPVAETTKKPDRVWRRGFLDEATVVPRGKFLAPSVGHPAWATVRVLRVHWQAKANQIVLDPVMRDLRELDLPNDELIKALATASPPRALVKLNISCHEEGLAPSLLAATGLPALRELDIVNLLDLDDPPVLRPLWTSPLGRQLRVLRIGVHPLYADTYAAEVKRAPTTLRVEIRTMR